MTHDEINALEAGPRLDALVWERFFKWRAVEPSYVPRFSQNLSAAGLILDELQKQGRDIDIWSHFDDSLENWHVNNEAECAMVLRGWKLPPHAEDPDEDNNWWERTRQFVISSHASTLPLAIARFAVMVSYIPEDGVFEG